MAHNNESEAAQAAWNSPGKLIYVKDRQVAFIVNRKCLIRVSHNYSGWIAHNLSADSYSDKQPTLKALLDCIGISLKRYN